MTTNKCEHPPNNIVKSYRNLTTENSRDIPIIGMACINCGIILKEDKIHYCNDCGHTCNYNTDSCCNCGRTQSLIYSYEKETINN